MNIDWTLVLMGLFASLALWSLGAYIVWQEKKKKTV